MKAPALSTPAAPCYGASMAPFVGFGFGPIQTGLMLYEAFASGSFDRAVVAEVDQGLVDAVRGAGNAVSVNIAGPNGIRAAVLSPCILYNPRVPADRAEIVKAVEQASEMATAVPSVDLYDAGAGASIASIIAAGTADRPAAHRVHGGEQQLRRRDPPREGARACPGEPPFPRCRSSTPWSAR